MVRAWAWIVGALSFLSPWGMLGLWPKPAAAEAPPTTTTTTATAPPKRPVVLVITKRIVYTRSPTSSVSTTGSGPIHYVYAPSTSSAATTCATPPC
jgi:hypothetical protein